MKKIQLTQGKVALVDDEDYFNLIQYGWVAHYKPTEDKWYAVATMYGKQVKMHRFILDTPDDLEVDHKDSDGLNNQRANIRNCTRSENLQNRRANRNSTSQSIGVYWEEWTSRWCASIKMDGYTKKIGRFDSEEEAARARDEYTKMWFGEHGRLNFPDE